MKTKLYITLAVLFLFGILNLINPAAGLELKALDLFRMGHRPHPDIVILAIDNKSIAQIGRFPWDRKIYAQVLEKLTAFQPRAMAFDINFSEPQDLENDQAFKQALDNAAFPVILAAEAVYTKDSNQPQKFLKPVSDFYEKQNIRLGNVNVEPDPDAYTRKLPVSLTAAGETIIPLSFQIAQSLGTQVSVKPNALVNFSGPAGSFPTFSFSDALNGKLKEGDLQNKIILIGATASDLRDYLAVPVPNQILPGVEYHANATDNILLNLPIAALPKAFPFAVGILSALIFALAALKIKYRALTILFLSLLAVVIGGSFIMWQLKYALPYFLNALLLLVLYLALSFYEWYITEKEKRKLRRTMQLYFSPAVYKLLLQYPKELKLGGERKEVTILFSDIRSFTTITETTDPEILTELLHEYFTEMTEEVLLTDGVLDKFIGDAVMAFWGAPFDQIDQADRAVKAALGMMKRLKILQAKWETKGWPFVNIGIGINTGVVTVGNMGSEKRFDYTVIGDSVNAASRLEGLNKEHHTNIIISEATKNKLAIPIQTRPLGDVLVKGKNVAIKIFEVLPNNNS